MEFSWFVSQGHVQDIIYRGTEDQLRPALMSDGKVPLVGSPICPDYLLNT